MSSVVAQVSAQCSLEGSFDAAFTARLAFREKQVQQAYRPIIGIHKWFARRPGSVFRSLLLSEFVGGDIAAEYWRPHDVPVLIADPFMGGGTTVFEALRLGMSVVGSDINPMSQWLVRQAVDHLDLDEFRAWGTQVWDELRSDVGHLYGTACENGHADADVKYFLWAKTAECPACEVDTMLFSNFRFAEAARHPSEVFYCPQCDRLQEVDRGVHPACDVCSRDLSKGNVRRTVADCLHCGHQFKFQAGLSSPPKHRMYALEYHCRECYKTTAGRQFKAPDLADLARVDEAQRKLAESRPQLRIPEDEIRRGDETDRLLRWGYSRYDELFNDRQLLALGMLMRRIAAVPNVRVRHALATVFSDFLRYQNLLCRYDTYALKCQDVFAVHGFPVALLACENNVPGIRRVGSGSFIHFVEKFARAKEYAKRPFETRYVLGKKEIVDLAPERIEAALIDSEPNPSAQAAWLANAPSQSLELRADSLDGVFTDPPYFSNVQYSELMDFCFVWLRQLLQDERSFEGSTTRHEGEATGNRTEGRGLAEFTLAMSEVFCSMSRAMKAEAPLVFTYHHNDATAYAPLVVAILDAGLTVTDVLAVPAEMSASLHIAGTKSSVLDSVFVCRRPGVGEVSQLTGEAALERDLAQMASIDYVCTPGDVQCLRAGHQAADAIRFLRVGWIPQQDVGEKLALVRARLLLQSDSDIMLV